MSRAVSRTSLLALVLLVALCAPAAAARPDERIDGQFIVVFDESVDRPGAATAARERRHGFRAKHRYAHAVKGFAARLTAGQVRSLRNDPAVEAVVADRVVRAGAALATGDTAPTGVRRIEAATSTTARGAASGAVAVIDTGIDLAHPDLRSHAVSGTNCIDPSRSAQDDEGHGTHVAGTIAAANDGTGVVGVAPGTKLYAVKVLDHNGSGSTSSVVCGIDWVTKNAASLGIRVANMSLGGTGAPVASCATTTDPEHRAICTSSDPSGAGVVYVVAAGNSGWDFDYAPQPDIPAAYPQVVTVSAMADSDGRPGGSGARCDREYDDRYAKFSNFAATSGGAAHTIAGPGVCITSTRLGGGTTALSGTSMASPHLAGAVALCIGEGATAGPCAGLASNDPGAYIAKLTGKSTDLSYGFYGDPNRPLSGRFYGHLAWPAPLAAPVESDTTAPAAPTGLTATSGDARVALDWADNGELDLARYEVLRSTTAGGPYATMGTATGSAYTDTAVTNGTTYHYVVRAVDTSGNVSATSSEASATPVASTASFTLSATGTKIKGIQHGDLSWKTNSTATSVDVYRNGARVTTTANDGFHRDRIGKNGSGTYTYKVCAAGTTTCSNEATVVFS